MKVVIAPDSFKESLSARHAAAAIARGVRQAVPDAQIVCIPMADGGEGTLDAVLSAAGGARKFCRVLDASGSERQGAWGLLEDNTAVIEMATAAGLELVPPAFRQPMTACSHGVGQLIKAALDARASRIILGLGGSSTNDGGAGMLTALGARFLDAEGLALAPGGAALVRLACLDTSGLDPRLQDVAFEVACDVDNPLCGASGASQVFGPQKGASADQVRELDLALETFANVCAAHLGVDLRDCPGAGAAGGLGFSALAFLRATFRPGVEIVAETGGLEAAINDATLVFTGEGRLDAQTLRGKTPAGVARIAQRAGVPVIALAGALGDGYEALYGCGVTAAFSLTSGPMTLASACANADGLLADRARDVMRMWVKATIDLT
ncbi:glycerate kinase [Achromobacter mucicolens]|uniref:glycerate kinase n=1 Tax=Achromobacter mucicolens TaxID=1389922 RepID=UPI00244C4A7A|nr:glycerate kinase [Achromobacter mucicolens]MDH0090988.1 glycerate kinase [Achromobacter mucicolens]